MLGHPGDLLVELDHAVLERRDLDEPRRHRHVDEGLAAAPAVRVAVIVGLAAHQDGARRDRGVLPLTVGGGLEVLDDEGVGLEDVQALVVVDREREAAVGAHGHHRGDAVLVGELLVLLTEGGGDVDDAGAVVGRHVVGREHDVGVRVAGVVRERWRVRPTDQVSPGEPLDDPLRGIRTELARVGSQARLGEHVPLGAPGRALGLDDDVVDVGAHGHREVARQGPRGRRPDEGELAGLEAVAHGDGRVLPVLVDLLVHAQLVVGQRRLVVPAVRQAAEALIDQALVVQGLERPEHRLHERRVERLVVVVEVDPTGLAGDVVLPLPGVLHDRLAALGVEGLDPDLEDLVLGLDAELAHRLELGGQAVGVPAEAALDVLAAHRLVAGDDVLDVAGQQVAVVRQAVGEGRAVVEDELVGAVDTGRALLDRGEEGVVLRPVGQDGLLDLREARARGDAEGGAGVLAGRGDRGIGHGSSCSCGSSTRNLWTRTNVSPAHDSVCRVLTSAVPPRLPHAWLRRPANRAPRHTTALGRRL